MEANGHFAVVNGEIKLAEVVAPFHTDSREVSELVRTITAAESTELEQLRAQVAAMKAERDAKMTLTLKVSEKGGISVYGLGRFPITLYSEQWEKIGKIIPQIEEFAKVNWKEISAKNTAARAAKAAKK